MYVNIIDSYRKVIAICDSELIGKRFEEGICQLDVKESFFKGEEKTEQETLDIMIDMKKEDATFNIMGDKSVALAVQAGIVAEENVGKIAGISYTLILL